MRNNDYTCDRCGAQFNESNGFTLSLSVKERARTMCYEQSMFSYDLCEGCAQAVQAKARDLIAEGKEAE